MNTNDFIKLREKDWQRLQTLINRRQGRGTLSAHEIRELGTLYRAVVSDLALARRDYAGQKVVQYLNQLLTRTHSYIYQEDVTDFRPALRYFTHTLPRAFRRTWTYTLVAFLLFIIPAFIGYRLMDANPDNADFFGLEQQRQQLADQSTWTNIPVNARPYASAFIMQNNIRIAIMVFGGGMVFGLFSVYALVSNGLVIGGVVGLAAHYNMAPTLIQFMVGHGVIELSVIFISGGAGLQLAWALLNPGPYTRRDAVAIAARRAIPLVLAAIPLLIIAGTIEGFFSPREDLSYSVHIAMGLVTGMLMYGYFLLAGRDDPVEALTGEDVKRPLTALD